MKKNTPTESPIRIRGIPFSAFPLVSVPPAGVSREERVPLTSNAVLHQRTSRNDPSRAGYMQRTSIEPRSIEYQMDRPSCPTDENLRDSGVYFGRTVDSRTGIKPTDVLSLNGNMEDKKEGTDSTPEFKPRSMEDLLNYLYGSGRESTIMHKRKGKKAMAKKKNEGIDLDDLMDMMGRRSLRRIFYRNIDDVTRLATSVVADTFHEFAENNLYTTLHIYGHYDTFISKSSVKVLLKYLYPKYGKHILMDVDGNFSMCSVSIEKIKKSVLGFPELVNKTIRPGIYWVKLSNVGKGTYMIVLKNKLYNEGDISENGIRSEAKNFKTTIIFIGERKIGWRKRIQKEIDGYCSNLVTTSASSDKIRVQSMGGGDNSQNDIIIRPMNNLVFPQKDGLLEKIQTFLDSGKIYKDNGIPYRKGYLFVGPRGTGKTSFAFSLADHFHMECVSVDLSYFDSNGGANAFNGSNTIYIIDEIDAQLPKSRVAETHEAITTEQQKIIDRLHKLLKAMDDMNDGCIIIGTTNFPERLDPAIVRSGRFDEQISFNNLSEKYAVMMCKNRGLDPDEILENEEFPINPSYLEQKLIEALLVKNNIERKQLKSADEIVSEEYGIDASSLSKDDDAIQDREFTEDLTPASLYDIIMKDFGPIRKNCNPGMFIMAVKTVMPDLDSDDITDVGVPNGMDDDLSISPKQAKAIYKLFVTKMKQADSKEKRNEIINAYAESLRIKMVQDQPSNDEEDAESQDTPSADNPDEAGKEIDTGKQEFASHYEVVASEEHDCRMVEDTDDDD